MRVLNDREEKSESSEIGFTSLVTHILMVSLGIASFVLAPIPMILSQQRLLEPWSKIAMVAGSVLALVALEVPLSAVILLFVLGLYVSDAVVNRQRSIWALLGSTALLALASSVLMLVSDALFERAEVFSHWFALVTAFVQQLKSVLRLEAPVEWELIQAILYFEAPFLVISGALLSAWISIGICAHAGWLGQKSVYDSNSLRLLKPSVILSLAFVLSMVGGRFLAADLSHLLAGFSRLLASLLFVEGTVLLSYWMHRKRIRNPIRTLFYGIFVVVGFYALVLIGLVSPLFLGKKLGKVIPDSLPLLKTEEV